MPYSVHHIFLRERMSVHAPTGSASAAESAVPMLDIVVTVTDFNEYKPEEGYCKGRFLVRYHKSRLSELLTRMHAGEMEVAEMEGSAAPRTVRWPAVPTEARGPLPAGTRRRPREAASRAQVCIDGAYLEELFNSHPIMPGRFFAFLATYQAKRLRQLTAMVPGAARRTRRPWRPRPRYRHHPPIGPSARRATSGECCRISIRPLACRTTGSVATSAFRAPRCENHEMTSRRWRGARR